MANTPLAIGAGSRLGSWGLRQPKDILIPIDSNIDFTNSLQVYFYSPSGELITALSAGRGDGLKLEITWNEDKYGGMKSFSIQMLKKTEIPFFTGMLVRFFLFNVPWSLGYVNRLPDKETDNELIKIGGLGYFSKLGDIVITETYTNIKPSEIIADISQYFSNVDIIYNPKKIILPNITITELIFTNKSLIDIIETLLKICNYQYQELQHVYGVDEYQEFYFYGIEVSNVKSHIFEGYNYQSPDVNTNINKIVNQVQAYRTQKTSKKETEYVATYQDSTSQENNGLFERKLTVADYVSNDEIAKIANAIIEENKDPRKGISINNLVLENRLPWGFYGITSKRDSQSVILSEFTETAQWTKTLTTSTITTQAGNVFTGRKCFNWSLNSSLGDKISLSFDRVYAPEKAIIYLRHSAKIEALKITFNGKEGYVINDTVTSADGTIEDAGETTFRNMVRGDGIAARNIDNLFINDWIAYEVEFENYFYIDDVEIEVISSGTVEILLDRLEVFNNAYKYNKLSLETVEYSYNGLSVLAAAEFGNKTDTLITELKKVDDKNRVPLEIISKQ